ncbi:glucokinase, variant [Sphaeroforma arctica JP610]|uniref:Glucokinase, variant n=1 Tax=Sphaeroforma arctica JP610 TaxID=667725 RepID=A0A0L0FFN2_9EUKA|nr:glucokinase, variant [Sphaeroforma arctica JP610]KNC74868.1 glucokinase, variant [Sphaeroforma arctica JP610]|eukprot:XP_014148770.1 glucokinase, variant [Sphaeroforma arctica JP610]
MGDRLVIVGDCGGTNTRLSLWSIPADAPEPKRKEKAPGTLQFDNKYQNEQHKNFLDIMKLFLEESKTSETPVAACLACAGPILDNTVSFTNIKNGWFISGSALEKQLNINKVLLVNDFTAMGYGLLTLADDECLILNDVPPKEGGVVATIGAGTGLGECFLTKDPKAKGYKCWATEGGHTDWAPHTDLEVEILAYARKKFRAKARVSVERIISVFICLRPWNCAHLRVPCAQKVPGEGHSRRTREIHERRCSERRYRCHEHQRV